MATITIQFENKPKVRIGCADTEAQRILEYIVFKGGTTERTPLPSTHDLLDHVKAHDNYEHCCVELAELLRPCIRNGGSERTRVVMNVSEKLRRIREDISKNESGEWMHHNKKLNDRRCKVYVFKKHGA